MSTISDKNYQTTHDLPLPQFQIWSRGYREASSNPTMKWGEGVKNDLK